MTAHDIIAGIIEREGEYVDHCADIGGPTRWGITAQVLGAWRKNGRQATRKEVQALTRREAAAIYAARYVRPFEAITDESLRVYLIDLGVLRGPYQAIAMLQQVLGVEADGVLGPKTFQALERYRHHILVMMIGARFYHIEQRVTENPTQAAFRDGWRNRNDSFLPMNACKE